MVGFHLCFQGFSKIFVNSVPTPWKAHDHPGRERVLGGQGAQISSSEFLGIGDLPLASHHAWLFCDMYRSVWCSTVHLLGFTKILLFVRCVDTLKHCFHPNIYGKWMDDQPRSPYVSPTPNRRSILATRPPRFHTKKTWGRRRDASKWVIYWLTVANNGVVYICAGGNGGPIMAYSYQQI